MPELPKISICIPVFNTELYIGECAKSIFEQQYQNLEIIFCDDCSTDNSLAIIHSVLKEYPKRCAQTYVIRNSTNSGPAITRDNAYKRATGDYIWFIDSDDWIESNAVTFLVDKAIVDRADILYFDYEVNNQSDSKLCYGNHSFDAETTLLQKLKTSKDVAMWAIFIRKSFLSTLNIKIPTDFNVGEDYAVHIQILKGNPKISYVSQLIYHYRRMSTSLSHRKSRMYFQEAIKMIYFIDSLLENDEQKKCFMTFKGSMKIQVMESRLFLVREVIGLFPEIRKECMHLDLPLSYRLALSFLGIGNYFIGKIILKIQKIIIS